MSKDEFIQEFQTQNFPDHFSFVLVRSEPKENSFFPDFYMDIRCIDKYELDSLDTTNFRLIRNDGNGKLPMFMIINDHWGSI